MSRTSRSKSIVVVCVLAGVLVSRASAQQEQVDFLTFAQGVTVQEITGANLDKLPGMDKVLQLIDGNPSGYVLTPKFATMDTAISITLVLPAVTRFSEFVVPNILETPSPSQTFVGKIKILGSSELSGDDFVLLAQAPLQVHESKGLSTWVTATPYQSRRIRLVLQGGLKMENDKAFIEFSELIGHGEQELVPLSEGFAGKWKGRGVAMELTQDGNMVTGCYDKRGKMSGTVDGKILRAIGVGMDDGVESTFVLLINEEGQLDGVRSTNGAPFRRYLGDATTNSLATACGEKEPPKLGCGSVLHGIKFDYDSADIRSESEPIIERLFEGLNSDSAAQIVIQGHTSSEGSDGYNQSLSERRALALADRLVSLGLSSETISAVGFGERQPIASNADEAGRSLNRRVEVVCE